MEEVNRSLREEEEFPIIIARVDSACVPTTKTFRDDDERRERERESSTKTKRKRGDLLEVSNGKNTSEDVLAFIQRTLETERKKDFARL